jgi:prolyl oligopeptidase
MKKSIFILTLFMAFEAQSQNLNYPATRKDSTVDTYFGKKIIDNYRWLEDDTSAETGAWVKAQNVVTQNYLAKITFRDSVLAELTKLWNYTKYSNPFKKGNYYYFYKNDGLQNQAVLYRQLGINGTPDVFIDPNTLTEDGTASLGSLSFSANNKYVAYSVSQSGSDWQDIFIMEVETKKQIADQITYTKFSDASWKGDDGFYYSGYDRPVSEEKKFSTKSEFQKIFYHRIGTLQNADALIYEDASDPLIYKSAGLTEDERFLILSLSKGTDGNEIQYWDLKDKTQNGFRVLAPGYKYNYSVIDNIGDKLLMYTNNGASNYRLVSVDPMLRADNTWKNILPPLQDKLDNVSIVGGQIFAQYLVDASTKVIRYNMEGKKIGEVSSAGIGTMAGFGGKKVDLETFYSFSSFNMPTTIYRYDIKTKKSSIFKSPDLAFNPEDYVVKQEKFKSLDGTLVPMFLVYKKGLEIKTGQTPVFLYGYGGFNISLTPSFSVPNIYFVQQGGIYAMVNLRGGSEYGEEWHAAGMLDKKQNVFDDFMSAAKYLFENKITNPQKLAIHGRSNGGLLVGACMTQRPDMFKVALPGVGVLDMLRYHKFTVGWGWAVEYGSSDVKEQFGTLYRYSPLHRLKKNTNYPATMITTADHDDRVVPAHSFKFAAALQDCSTPQSNPFLIRIDAKAGHGAGKPTGKQISEWADIMSFTMFNLGMRK